MAYRKLEKKDLIGKTVRSFNNDSVNVVKLEFTDGSKLELWAEDAVSTPAGSIPGIFVDD